MRSWEGYFVQDALKLLAFAVGGVLALGAVCWGLALLTMEVFSL